MSVKVKLQYSESIQTDVLVSNGFRDKTADFLLFDPQPNTYNNTKTTHLVGSVPRPGIRLLYGNDLLYKIKQTINQGEKILL